MGQMIEIEMNWRIAIACCGIFAQGCRSQPITYHFPAYHTDNPEQRIAGYSVTIQGADLISIENMDASWDTAFETGWFRSAETGRQCQPRVTGTCHHGAEAFWDSGNLPCLILKSEPGTNTITVSGRLQLLKKWDDESTPDITFTNMLPIER